MRSAREPSRYPAGELITTIGGIRRTQWTEQRFPTIEELDEAAAQHAVYLSERGAGPGQTNTAARDLLRGLGVDVSDDGTIANGPETVSRLDAVYMYSSVEQGWFTKEDDLLGGIGVGRFADIAVLAADVFDPDEVSDADIRHMTSVLTIVGGEIVHDAGVLETR